MKISEELLLYAWGCFTGLVGTLFLSFMIVGLGCSR